MEKGKLAVIYTFLWSQVAVDTGVEYITRNSGLSKVDGQQQAYTWIPDPFFLPPKARSYFFVVAWHEFLAHESHVTLTYLSSNQVFSIRRKSKGRNSLPVQKKKSHCEMLQNQYNIGIFNSIKLSNDKVSVMFLYNFTRAKHYILICLGVEAT